MRSIVEGASWSGLSSLVISFTAKACNNGPVRLEVSLTKHSPAHDILVSAYTGQPARDHACPALHRQTQHGKHSIDVRDEYALGETPSVLWPNIRPSYR
jgi:hypothetical protein